MKKLSETFKEKIRKPKTQMALGLAIAAMGIIAPATSQSTDYCKIPGSYGDCDESGSDMRCTEGGIWDDCNVAAGQE